MKFKYLNILLLITMFFHETPCFSNNVFDIKGVNPEIKQNILSYMSATNISCQSTESQVNTFIKNIPTKIRKSIRPFGYYDSKIELKKLPKEKECWKITIAIDLGRPIVLNNVDLNIVGDTMTKQNARLFELRFPLKKRDILRHDIYESFKSSLQTQASELGYLDAKFSTNTIDVFTEKQHADISLHFDTGVRYKIDKIVIIQNPEFLRDDFIAKLMTLKPDNYFTNSQLFSIRKKLASTGYFGQVSVEVDHINRTNGSVPIKILLTPGDRIKYSTGLGFSTDAGLRMSFDYNQNRVTDFGYQLNSKLSSSEVLSELTTGIKMPSKSNPLFKWYSIDAGYQRERTDTTSSDTSKLGFSQTRIHENKWQNINFIDLVDEKFEDGDNQKQSLLLVPGTSWSYTKADNPRIPMKGYKIQTEIRGASHSVVSDVSFAQLDFSYKAIYPILDRNRLIYRGRIGTTLINDLSLLPSSYRYYTGGDNSIRGYDYNMLSPTNDEGDAIGGKHLFISSIEYEHRIGEQWAIAVFTDVGNAFSDSFKLEKSVGTGLRWFSPIGPVRFDIGVPINDEKNDFQIHITVGPDF